MLKTFEVSLDLENQTANSAFTISQNDLKTIEIIFTVTQDKKPVDLTGTLPRIAILKPSGNTVIQDCTLDVDPTKGNFQIILDSQAYVEVGVHTCEVYIYSGDQVAVTGTFTYNSRIGIFSDTTLTSTNDWQAINDALANYMTNDQAKALIDSIIAQNGGVNLQNYYTKTDVDTQMASVNASLADMTTKQGDLTQLNTTDKTSIVNALKEIKSQSNSNTTSISNIGNASPKGTYATVTDLQTAFPTGTTGIYVVTADGKWYYWAGSAWTAGGTYQSTTVADNTLVESQLSTTLKTNYIDYGWTAKVKPLIWTGGKVITGKDSFSTVGDVGVIHGEGKYIKFAQCSFAGLTFTQLVVARGADRKTTNLALTLQVIGLSSLLPTDIVVAWVDQQYTSSVKSIFDNSLSSVKPLIWSGGSVGKTTTSFTTAGDTGFFFDNGGWIKLSPCNFTGLAFVDLIVIRNLSKFNTGLTLTAEKITLSALTPNDVVIAWKDANEVKTIFDDLLKNNTISTAKVKPWLWTGGKVTKTSSSIKFSGQVGGSFASGHYFLMDPIEFTGINQFEYIVLRGLDFSKHNDGSQAPKPIPIKVTYTSLLIDDIILAWRDQITVYSIYDDMIRTNTIPTVPVMPSNIMSKCFPSVTTKILDKSSTVNVLLVGDSIFEHSGAWTWGTYAESSRYSDLLPTPSGEPMQLTNKIISRGIYDQLVNEYQNKPVYRRFDYGKVFDYNSASATYGQDITPTGQAFFTETGVFHTFASSDGNGGSDSAYNSKVPMTLADFKLAFSGSTWYKSGGTEGFTRKTYDANASVQFTIPSGYKKVRVRVRNALDGDVLTVALTNCTGVSSIDTNYGTVTHNNNSMFKDIEFTVTDTTQAATITLTKSSNTSKALMYWGCYYYNEPTVLVNNFAYGGCHTGINKDVLPDALSSISGTYDLIIWELMLLNDISQDLNTALTWISQYCDAIAGQNVLAVVPHMSLHYSDANGYQLWNKAKKILIDKNIPFIDLSSMEKQLVDFYGDYTTLIANMFFNSGAHPNLQGVNILKKYIQAVLQFNEFHKV